MYFSWMCGFLIAEYFKEAICDIFVELVMHIPNIILTGVILAAIIFVLRKVNKKKQKKQKEDK